MPPRPMWERWVKPDKIGRIPLACRSLLIECDGKKILCETGIGAFFDPVKAERYGVQTPEKHLLRENLQKIGIPHDQIDYVILSHLHFDHAGGLLPPYSEIQKGKDDLLFPKAKYIVGKEAFERAMHPHSRDRVSFVPLIVEKLQSSKRMIIVEGDNVPGLFEDRLSFMYTWGHTPGHMHTVFKGDTKTIFFAGDLIPGTAWVHLPITMGYDRYPEKLIDEKALLYETAAPESWILFYTHDHRVSCSSVRKNEKGKFEAFDSIEPLVHHPI